MQISNGEIKVVHVVPSDLHHDVFLEIELHLTFRHRASCILGQAFRYSPENAFYIFNPYPIAFPYVNAVG